MTKIVSLWEFSGSSARFGISEVLRISPRFYWYIRTCSIITKLGAMTLKVKNIKGTDNYGNKKHTRRNN